MAKRTTMLKYAKRWLGASAILVAVLLAGCSDEAAPSLVGKTLPSPTVAEIPISRPTATHTPAPTATLTPTNTPQPTATPTPTSTPLPMSAPTSTPTVTPTSTPPHTATPTSTPTVTPTSTPPPTATPTPAPSQERPLQNLQNLPFLRSKRGTRSGAEQGVPGFNVRSPI